MTEPTQAGEQGVAPKLGRRTWVIDRRFQYKYTALLALLGGAISVLFACLMYFAHRDALATVLAGKPIPAEVATQSATLLWLMVTIAVLMAVALGLFGLLVTHRVAGPVYVMNHYVGILARGRYPIMRPLRRNDELKDFFGGFQSAIEALRAREVEEAELLETALEQWAPVATSPEAQQTLEALRQVHARKRDATDRVDIGGGTGHKSAA